MALPKQQTTPLETQNLAKPQEVRTFPRGRLELVTVAGITFGRATFEPGWRWSTDVKPIAKTESCEAAHLGIQLSGTMHVVMNDGTTRDTVAGDVINIPPGHDAWVVGNEAVVMVDITGMDNYAKQRVAA